jgi:hypothetical protein
VALNYHRSGAYYSGKYSEFSCTSSLTDVLYSGLPVFGPELYVLLSDLSLKGVDLLQISAAFDDVCPSLLRVAVIVSSLSYHQNIDVPGASAGHNVDHSDTDVHLPSSLWRKNRLPLCIWPVVSTNKLDTRPDLE